jgi:hypothetical protein
MLCPPFMHGAPRLTAGALAVVLLVVGRAGAQPASEPSPPAVPPAPPETLETPYEEPPAPLPPKPSQTPPPPVAPAPKQPPDALTAALQAKSPDTRPPLPIRAERRLVLTGELGWNGLAGFGPILTYHAHPHFSLDLGVGISLLGPKAGLRGRYNFLSSNFTPFVGMGFNATEGLGEFTTDPENDPNADPAREPATIRADASYLIQAVAGFDYTHRRGFTMVGCVGYAHLLNYDNYKVLAGSLTEEERLGFDIAFKGGLVLSLALGYAFK